MSTIVQTLSAGIKHRLPCNGYFFQLLEASANVNLVFISAGRMPQSEAHNNIGAGFWFKSPELLTFVDITSEIDQQIEYVYSLGQTGYDRTQTLSRLLQATVITDRARVTVTTSRSHVVNSSTGRTRIIFTADEGNSGVISIGGVSVNGENAAINLSAGDSWVEEKAALADFYAMADHGSQYLRISEA